METEGKSKAIIVEWGGGGGGGLGGGGCSGQSCLYRLPIARSGFCHAASRILEDAIINRPTSIPHPPYSFDAALPIAKVRSLKLLFGLDLRWRLEGGEIGFRKSLLLNADD